MDKVKTKYESIAIESIKDPALAMRSDVTQESVEDLAKSISQVGLIEPIVVKRNGDSYEVIAGHRRLLACRIAGLAFVPCKIIEVNNEMVETLKVHENLYREDVNVVDEAHFIKNAMDKLKIDVDTMADLIGKSRTYVLDRLRILEFPDFLYNAVKDKKLKFSIALELFKIDNIDVLRQYTEYASLNGVTQEVAREWVRRYKVDSLATNPPTVEEVKQQAEIKDAPILKVKCGICGEELPLREAKIFYCCYECYKKISQ